MTSKLTGDLVSREGLDSLLAMRERGTVPAGAALLDLLARSSILALGAAADIVRRRECGDETRIHIPRAPAPSDGLIVIDARVGARGTALLRRIATERLTGRDGLRIVVDFGALGLEIAQVALSFGATDLAGPIASGRGLPLVDHDDQKKLVKRREIAAFVERAGFRPVFVSEETRAETAPTAPDVASRPHVDS